MKRRGFLALALAVALVVGCAWASWQKRYEIGSLLGRTGGAIQDAVSERTDELKKKDEKEADSDSLYTDWSMEGYPDYVRSIKDGEKSRLAFIRKYELSGSRPAAKYRLDAQGRAEGSSAVIDYRMMREGSDRERDDMQSIRPSGWQRNRIVTIRGRDGKSYRGYFYNRSHLLAKSLGGKDTLENMITGTRMQNVGMNDGNGGMAYVETRTRKWLYANRGSLVKYTAVPVYRGNERLARSVLVEARSTDGRFRICIEVYNAANGWSIDYSDGAYRAA